MYYTYIISRYETEAVLSELNILYKVCVVSGGRVKPLCIHLTKHSFRIVTLQKLNNSHEVFGFYGKHINL